MDQELIAYFDQRFRETSQQISEATRQISDLREETARQISDLREETTRRFSETTQQISDFRKETAQQFERVDARFEQVEATARQTLVLFEGLRHEVHVIAEGFLGLNGQLERYYSEAKLSFEQVKAWIEPYYRDLGRRVSILEGGRDRMHEDVVEAVQRLLGRPPYQPPAASD
jgi:ABC-type transporter Mla subunit MlaD